MYCSECGKEVKGKVKFCPFCGTEQFEDNSTGQAVSEGRAAKEKQERTGSHFKIPIIAIAIIIVGMLLIGLRGEFGASLWEHKENVFDESSCNKHPRTIFRSVGQRTGMNLIVEPHHSLLNDLFASDDAIDQMHFLK